MSRTACYFLRCHYRRNSFMIIFGRITSWLKTWAWGPVVHQIIGTDLAFYDIFVGWPPSAYNLLPPPPRANGPSHFEVALTNEKTQDHRAEGRYRSPCDQACTYYILALAALPGRTSAQLTPRAHPIAGADPSCPPPQATDWQTTPVRICWPTVSAKVP